MTHPRTDWTRTEIAGLFDLPFTELLFQAASVHRAYHPATEVQLRADRNVPYGRVAELIGWVQQAGLTRIGFVVEAQPAR